MGRKRQEQNLVADAQGHPLGRQQWTAARRFFPGRFRERLFLFAGIFGPGLDGLAEVVGQAPLLAGLRTFFGKGLGAEGLTGGKAMFSSVFLGVEFMGF